MGAQPEETKLKIDTRLWPVCDEIAFFWCHRCCHINASEFSVRRRDSETQKLTNGKYMRFSSFFVDATERVDGPRSSGRSLSFYLVAGRQMDCKFCTINEQFTADNTLPIRLD